MRVGNDVSQGHGASKSCLIFKKENNVTTSAMLG